ncbi:MAG: hypothetical protein ACLQED_08215 [Desulfobaccales bacterium]
MSAKKTKPEPDDKKQYARFIEAAKQIDNPDAKKAFEEAMAKIVKNKKAPRE